MTLLALDKITVRHGQLTAVNALSLDLADGATLAVIGANGAGKTTLLRAIAGTLAPAEGTITFDGNDFTRMPAHKRAANGIRLVPEGRRLFPSLTVEENLLVAARPGEWTAERVYDLFPSLAARRKNRGNHLSGGEQQMLAIGRALMSNPSLLLMDEPLEGLAPVIVDMLLAAFGRLKSEDNLTLVLVEQHARLALDFAENAIVLDRGAIVFSGMSRDLLDAPQRLDALMGVAGRTPR
jgi:branched-chain amino acid transport system ATP-binding protein